LPSWVTARALHRGGHVDAADMRANKPLSRSVTMTKPMMADRSTAASPSLPSLANGEGREGLRRMA